MTRAEQKEKRRREILYAGLDLFIRRGFAATRTAEIAEAVGMSEGLLFHYFSTKEALYRSLLELAESGKDRIFSRTDFSPLEFFEETAKAILSYVAEEPFAAKLFVLMNRAQYDEALSEQVRKRTFRGRDVEYAVKLIGQGQKEGSIRSGDPLALAIAFFMAIQGIAENVARNPELPVPEYEWIVDIVRGK